MVRYIGIDPSTKTGLVILDEKGEVVLAQEITTKEEREPHKFMEISGNAVNHFTYIDKVMIEGFSYGSRGKSVSSQYGIGWAFRIDLTCSHIPYIDIPPTTLKKFATGKGNCAKDVVMREVYKRWGFENDSNNIVDAYVLAQIGRALDGLGEPTKAQMDCIKGLVK